MLWRAAASATRVPGFCCLLGTYGDPLSSLSPCLSPVLLNSETASPGSITSLLPAPRQKMDELLSRPTSFCDDKAGLLTWFSPLPFSSCEVSKEECEELNAWKHERDDLGARNSSSLICRTLGFCPRTGIQNLNLTLQWGICISLRKVPLEDRVLLPCVY